MRQTPRAVLAAFALGSGIVAAGCSGGETGGPESTNAPPVVERLSAEERPVEPGQTVGLEVRASDPDLGDGAGAADAGAASGLSYEWSTSSEDWRLEASGPSAELTAPDAYGAETTVRVVVLDEAGASAEASLQIEVRGNRRPLLRSVGASPNPVAAGGTTTLSAATSDPDGDASSYRWRAPDGWSLSKTEGTSVDLEAPATEGAIGAVELEVTDGHGGTATGTIQVETTTNRPPSIASMTADPPQVARGGTTRLKVAATDRDGEQLSYSWSAPSGWTVNGSGAEVDVTAPSGYGERASIEVEVTDGNGQSATARVQVSTVTNGGPRVASMTADPPQVARGGTIDVAVQASDPNGDTLSYQWSVGSMNWSVSGSGASATVDAPDASGARTSVEVVVTDGEGLSVKASVVVSTRPNRPPRVASVTASPRSLVAGGTSTLEATATDPEGESLSYTWTAPSGWTISGSGAQVTLQAPASTGKTAVVQVTVEDSSGAKATGSVAVETERNRPPTVASVTASPAVLDKGGTSTLEAFASDPNGDALSYSWSGPSGWTLGATSGKTVQVTAPNQYGQTARFEVVVTDGNGGQTTGAVTVETSRNQPPYGASMSATPNPVLQNAKSTVKVAATDDDGDALSYSWSLDDSDWTKSGSGDEITLDAPNKASSSVKVTVTITDGNGGQTSRSITVQTKACPTDTGNCDGDASNGCEADLDSDANHCGVCGNSCGTGAVCDQGTCRLPPECASSTYTELTQSNRHVSFNDGNGGTEICDDNMGNNWYRLTGSAGTKMPTSAPSRYSCGTDAPGWIDGSHPSPSDGRVNRRVCFHWDFGTCEWSTQIKVRNCGGSYFVYKFPDTPTCYLRYCGE